MWLCELPLLLCLLLFQAAMEVLQVDTWPKAEAALRQISHAPKLAALRDLLNQCGIVSAGALGGSGDDYGDCDAEAGSGAGASGTGGSGGHRMLVFAQLKGMLDLVERDVLQVGLMEVASGVRKASRVGGTAMETVMRRPAAGQGRAGQAVFAQLKGMLDLVERDVLQAGLMEVFQG